MISELERLRSCATSTPAAANASVYWPCAREERRKNFYFSRERRAVLSLQWGGRVRRGVPCQWRPTTPPRSPPASGSCCCSRTRPWCRRGVGRVAAHSLRPPRGQQEALCGGAHPHRPAAGMAPRMSVCASKNGDGPEPSCDLAVCRASSGLLRNTTRAKLLKGTEPSPLTLVGARPRAPRRTDSHVYISISPSPSLQLVRGVAPPR